MPAAYPTFGAPVGPPLPGGVRRNEYGGPGAGGFVRIGGPAGGPVRSGVGVKPAPVTVGRAPGLAAPAPWTPPAFPPTGTFNPSRELETEEAGRGLGQLEGDVATKEARARTDYATHMGDFTRETNEQDTALKNGLALLAESFQKLGTSQEERANRAGVLQGGALLQAAAKRSANEGKEKTKDQEGHDKAVADIGRARSAYALDWAPPDASNPLGGRAWQDFATQLANARGNNVFYGQGQQQLAAQEAAEHGFTGYQAPRASDVPAWGNTGNASVRVGNPHVPYLRGRRR